MVHEPVHIVQLFTAHSVKQGKYPQKKSFKTVRPICFLIFGLSNSENF